MKAAIGILGALVAYALLVSLALLIATLIAAPESFF